MKFISNSEEETLKFAEEFASKLQGGEILALIGDLGAGKTAFTRGLARGLGIKNYVNSPTFVLMKVYKARQPRIKCLAHIDAYRLENSQQLVGIGVEDYFGAEDTVTVVEWADRVADILPKQVIKINFKHGKNNRIITIK